MIWAESLLQAQIQIQFSTYTQSTLQLKLVEITSQFFLSCLNYSDERFSLLNEIKSFNPNTFLTNSQITHVFL